jgi:serine/threonine-protein kinase
MMSAVGPGSRLAGRYVLDEHIASGGMAAVWRAHDEVLARTVAVKVLKEELSANWEFRERFRREAVAAARLNHHSIINVFDTGTDHDVVFIVMEYFPGRTLAAILAERRFLEPTQAVDLMIPVLDALDYAHSHGVVHRDVKPANILVAEDRVKVTDFGIAKAAEAGGDLTATGKVLGTVHYLAPEQVEGSAVDARSDIYAAGAVLYETVAGRPPFQAETAVATAMMRLTSNPIPPRDVRPGVPRALEAVIMRALARDPDQRFPSAQAMRTSLESAAGSVSEEPVTRAMPVATVAESAPPSSVFRSWMLVPLIVVVVAAVVVAVGLALGTLQLGGPLGVRGAHSSGSSGGADAGPQFQIVGARDYDPFGDQEEHSADVPLAIDGKTSTAWTTDHYSSAGFGNLKPGLGLWLDFGRTVNLGQIEVQSPLSGWKFELLPGPQPNENAQPLASTGGQVDFVVDEGGRALVDLAPKEVRGVMIWIIQLAPDQGRFAASISEVTAREAS